MRTSNYLIAQRQFEVSAAPRLSSIFPSHIRGPQLSLELSVAAWMFLNLLPADVVRYSRIKDDFCDLWSIHLHGRWHVGSFRFHGLEGDCHQMPLPDQSMPNEQDVYYITVVCSPSARSYTTIFARRI